jgi:SprT protein
MKQETLQNLANGLWDDYAEIFPSLVRFDCPTIKLNNRFSATAGRATFSKNLVELSAKHLAKFPEIVLNETLPHELAHMIDYYVYGMEAGKQVHGTQWKIIMVALGQNPTRCHSMVL